LNSVYKLKI